MKKIKLEFVFNSSIGLLYPLIATNNGLSTWFANNVSNKNNLYFFDWNGSVDEAELVYSRPGQSIRFRWAESHGKSEYFEMKLVYDELISQVSLLITDFAEKDEVDDIKLFWENQVANLYKVVGL